MADLATADVDSYMADAALAIEYQITGLKFTSADGASATCLRCCTVR